MENKRQSLSRLAAKLQVMSAGQAKTDPEDEKIRIYDLLLAVERGPQRRSMMESHLSEVLAGVLKQDQSLINSEAPFSTMGLRFTYGFRI